MEAERSANKYKQVEYMQDYVGEDFDAIVSGTASFGFWAETVEHKCEGMVSIADLSGFDDFELLEHEYALVGRNTGIRLRIGDKVKVKVVAANLDKRQIDFTILELPEQAGGAPVPKKKRERTFEAPKDKGRSKRKK
jgi:ribonuclease R